MIVITNNVAIVTLSYVFVIDNIKLIRVKTSVMIITIISYNLYAVMNKDINIVLELTLSLPRATIVAKLGYPPISI